MAHLQLGKQQQLDGRSCCWDSGGSQTYLGWGEGSVAPSLSARGRRTTEIQHSSPQSPRPLPGPTTHTHTHTHASPQSCSSPAKLYLLPSSRHGPRRPASTSTSTSSSTTLTLTFPHNRKLALRAAPRSYAIRWPVRARGMARRAVVPLLAFLSTRTAATSSVRPRVLSCRSNRLEALTPSIHPSIPCCFHLSVRFFCLFRTWAAQQ